MGFLFTVEIFCTGFAAFEIQTQSSHLSVTENPQTRSCCQPEPVRASGCYEQKINHAMKNNSQKISSTSYEVKTPLDSNRKIFPPNSTAQASGFTLKTKI